MGELIKIGFHGEDFYGSTVSARRIHELLEVKKDFTNWFKYHANHMGLAEDVDYVKVKLVMPKLANQDGKHGGDRKSVDYTISVDTAKHLCMASNTKMSHTIRNHFIEVEKQYYAEKTQEMALWNNPDYVIPRALQMAEQQIEELREIALSKL